MKRKSISILMILMISLTVLAAGVFAKENQQTAGLGMEYDNIKTKAAETYDVSYRTHVQDIGWESSWMANGYTAGTQGRSQRLEGIQIKLVGNVPLGAKIEYRTHVQDVGWETQWASNGQIAGTQSKGLRLEGIQIRLVNMPGYSVQYRTHVQDLGWETDWVENGETSGTQGKSLRLEGIQIRIVKNTANLAKYNEIVATAKEVSKDKYTAESWAYLQATMTGFAVGSENTQAEVDLATNTIQNAFAALVIKDNSVYYAKAGTFGPAIGTTTIKESVVIKADGVTLRNTHITGNLTIAEEVGDGEVILNNVTVDGDTFIRGGGTDSIYINGGSYSKITIQKTATGEVRVVVSGIGGLDVVIAEGAADDEVILEGIFDTVQIDAPGVIVSTSGITAINKMVVSATATGSRVVINTNATVTKMTINAKMDIRGQGQIIKADINADNVTYEKIPETMDVDPDVVVPPVEVKEPVVLITDMKVTSANDTTTIAVGGSLQMSVTITPANATNKAVKWSLINPDGSAAITSTGLVSAKRTGAVTVQAAALDDSEITATKTIVINDPGVPTISSNSDILFNVKDQDFVVKLENDTFTETANILTNWISNMGETGLTISSITRNSDTQVTVHTTGMAKAGIITIKAKTAALTRGIESNLITINVPVIHVTGITIGGANITEDNGKTQLTASVIPADASNKKIVWSIKSGETCAKISADGLVTALKDGDVVVRGTAADNSGTFGELTIKITNQFESTLTATPATISNGAESPTIVVTLTNDKFTAKTIVENKENWTVSGTTGLNIDSIVRDSDTQVTMKLKGPAQYGDFKLQTKETASVNAEVSNPAIVTVPPIPVASVSIVTQKMDLIAGKTAKLEASVLPLNASIKTLTWKSSDDVVATVDAEGVVTAKYEGLVFITATSHDGKQSATCVVIVGASQDQNQAIVDSEAKKYEGDVTIGKAELANVDVTGKAAKLTSGNAARADVVLSYKLFKPDNPTATTTDSTYLKITDNKIILKEQRTKPGDAYEKLLITFVKEGKIATKEVAITIQTTTTLDNTSLAKITYNFSVPAAIANQEALTPPDSGTVIGGNYTFLANAPLQTYASSNLAQGSGKWVGFVIDTGIKQPIIGLSVDTGSGTYYDFTAADITEAMNAGATGDGKFVFWMKADTVDIAATRTLKIKNGTDIKIITINVVDFAFADIEKNPDNIFNLPNDEVTNVTFANNAVTISGTIPYQTEKIGRPAAGSNLIGLKISLKNVNKAKTEFIARKGTDDEYFASDLWKYDGNYFYYVGEITDLTDKITLIVDYDGDWTKTNDQISCVLSIATGTVISEPTQSQVLEVIAPTIKPTIANSVEVKNSITVDYDASAITTLSVVEKSKISGYFADTKIILPGSTTLIGKKLTVKYGTTGSYDVTLTEANQTVYLSEIRSQGPVAVENIQGPYQLDFTSSNIVDNLNFDVQSVIRDKKTPTEEIKPYGSLIKFSYKP